MNSEDKDQTPEAEGAIDAAANELQVAKAEAADWRDKYLRKLAEFDNFRKRSRQELSSLRDLLAEELMVSLLPVVDDFDRLIHNVANTDNDQYHRGVELIYGKLNTFLESRGVAKFDCVGKPFDPSLHEAMLMQPTPDFPSGTVLAEMIPGYKLGERVIRHAQVIVSAELESKAGDTGGDPHP